jgi:prepilin-type N-terminal cleavage/methylation domain-containing protein
MCIVVVKRARRRGFTLLEITLAVAILAMMAMAIYRFVATNIISMRISAQENAADARYSGFINLLSTQWQQLPSGVGALTGEPFKFSDQSRDEITWICGSGPGLLTRYAAGDFLVSMRLRPVDEKSGQMEIGFMRKPSDTPEGETEGQSWVSVLDGVTGLQIRYFDPRLNVWVEKWTDTMVMPRLIKLVINRPDRPEPFESIIALGRTPLPILPPTLQLQQALQSPLTPLTPQTQPQLSPQTQQPGKLGQPGK